MIVFQQKQCSGPCKKFLDANTFFFYPSKNGKYGLRSECIVCNKQINSQTEPSPQRKEYQKTYNKEYRKKNKEKLVEYYVEWKQDNKKHLQEYIAGYFRERRKTDIAFKILGNLRSRLYEAVAKGSKSDKTMTILGCSVHQLMKHLEAKFTAGMSWDNYGDWHIDHILPCASFDLTKEEEQRKCFHYSNLQPLWAADNIRKGDKVSP